MVDITRQADHLTISIPESRFMEWAALLRRGVGVVLEQPVTVREFMTSVLHMDLEYATNNVPGLFLNNAPVDDWTKELVGGGDEVGMSGTMPGMAGIALRRSSPIKAFRADLLSRHDEAARPGGIAVVKLFNFVAKDCCRSVLRRGVVIAAQMLRAYIEEQGIRLDGCGITWNGSSLQGDEALRKVAGLDADIELRLTLE